MANDIDRIVKLAITRQTTTPTMASFNGILIAAEFLANSATPVFDASERVRQYGSLEEISLAGFDSDGFVYIAASKIFSQNPAVDRIYVGRKKTGDDGAEDWDDALAAMLSENGDWYGVVVSTRTKTDQQKVADWVEASKKLCILASSDTSIINNAFNETPADIADYIRVNNYDRTAVFYHPQAGSLTDEVAPEAAWMGKGFPKDPGSITWAFKTLSGVPTYALASAQITNAEGKYANFYTLVADVAITQFGRVGSGEYIDVIHGIDWLSARIQNLVFTPLVQQDKVQYTDVGVQIVVSQLKAALEEAIDVGLLASFEVSFPLVADISADKKRERTLPDVKFTAVLAGAIHKVQIDGVVTL